MRARGVDALVVVVIVAIGVLVAASLRPSDPIDLPLTCSQSGETSGYFVSYDSQTYDSPSAPWFSERKAVALTEALHGALPRGTTVAFASPSESLQFGGVPDGILKMPADVSPEASARTTATGTLQRAGRTGSMVVSMGRTEQGVPACGPTVERRVRLHDDTVVDLSPGGALAVATDGTVVQVGADNGVLTQAELLDIVSTSGLRISAPVPEKTSTRPPVCRAENGDGGSPFDRKRLASVGRALSSAWDDGPGRRIDVDRSLDGLALQDRSTTTACIEVRTSVSGRSGTLTVGVSSGDEAPRSPDVHDPEQDRSRDHVQLDGGAVSARSRTGSPSVVVVRPSGTVVSLTSHEDVEAEVPYLSIGDLEDIARAPGLDVDPYARPVVRTNEVPDIEDSAWTITAAEANGTFSTFSDPRHGSGYPGAPGVIDAGDVTVVLAGKFDPTTGATDDPTLLGIDTSGGQVRWTVPAADLVSCADRLLQSSLLCLRTEAGTSATSVLAVETRTGEQTSRPSSDTLFGIGTDGNALYSVVGTVTPQGYPGTTLLRKGSLDDPAADWTVPTPLVSGYAEYPGQAVTVDGGLGTVNFTSDAVGFDPSTGAIRWFRGQPDSCVSGVSTAAGGVTTVRRMTCGQSPDPITGHEVIAADGRVLARTPGPSYSYDEWDSSTADFPLLVGTSAVDRVTGRIVWSEPSLADTNGTAVVGDVVLVRAPGTADVSAFDLRTGALLWKQSASDFDPVTAEVEGRAASVVSDPDGSVSMQLLDVRSGAVTTRELVAAGARRDEDIRGVVATSSAGVLFVDRDRIGLLR